MVEAAGISLRGSDGGSGTVEQGHDHTLNAGLASILRTVLIEVLPHEVTKTGEGADKASICRVIDLTRSEHDLRRGAGAIRITIGAVSSRIGRGEHAAIVQTDRESHRVSAGCQIGEPVAACGIRLGDADSGASTVEQGNCHALNARLARLLDAVAIQVFPNIVSERGTIREITGVDVGHILSCGEHDVTDVACGGVRITTRGRGALPSLREHAARSRLQRELHRVCAGLKLGEDVVASRAGHRAADGHAAAVEQCHGHALDAGLTGILHAIAIQVLPHKITETGEGRDIPCIPRWIVFTSHESGGESAARGRASVAVTSIQTLICRRQYAALAKVQREAHAVVFRVQVGEAVVAHAVRGGGADGDANAIVKGDVHSFDTRLAGVLATIAVEILPDVIAEAGLGRVVACVDGGNVLAFG